MYVCIGEGGERKKEWRCGQHFDKDVSINARVLADPNALLFPIADSLSLSPLFLSLLSFIYYLFANLISALLCGEAARIQCVSLTLLIHSSLLFFTQQPFLTITTT